MHNNYYLLKQLSQALQSTLKGTVVSECFSQNKDELIVRFETEGDPFFIRASLQAVFSCLSFPSEFNRARKNSVDLFEAIIGRRVRGLRQFANERSFALELEDNLSLLFKMHGNKSNIILFEGDGIQEMFRKNLQGDEALDLHALDRTIDWSKEHFMANQSTLRKIYFTFGPVVWKYLEEKDFGSKPADAQWEALQELLQQLERGHYYITALDGTLALSLLPFGEIKEESKDPVQALNIFSLRYLQSEAFKKEKDAALKEINSRLDGCGNYIDKLTRRLDDTTQQNHYKLWADLLMANLHTIEEGATAVELANFQDNNAPVSIKLKRALSPQRNAEVFYRKAKNQAIEIEHIQKTLQVKEKETEALQTWLQSVQEAKDLDTLRKAVGELMKEKTRKDRISLPYHEIEYNGFIIRVGKNAQHNDELTLKHTFKDDLWLHAKDVAGSHVVVKHQAGKTIPRDVIKKAAQLAAYNSKRKNESLVPVSVTPKKFVRKRKGDPPGAMVVEREDIVMAEPKME